MTKHLPDLAAEYRRLAETYAHAAETLRSGLSSANTEYLRRHQQDAINKAEARAADLNDRAAEIDNLISEVSWWRAAYPSVQPEGA